MASDFTYSKFASAVNPINPIILDVALYYRGIVWSIGYSLAFPLRSNTNESESIKTGIIIPFSSQLSMFTITLDNKLVVLERNKKTKNFRFEFYSISVSSFIIRPSSTNCICSMSKTYLFIWFSIF